MSSDPIRSDVPPFQQFWWLHDARWYQGVAKRFGQDAANEINAEALKFVARRVAAWCAQTYGIKLDPDLPLAEFLKSYEHVQHTMWPAGMMSVEHIVHSEDEFETVVTDNFALKMLRSAGSLEGYECPCLDMRAGWYEGVGISVQDSCLECERTGGSACRFRAVVTRPTPSSAAESP